MVKAMNEGRERLSLPLSAVGFVKLRAMLHVLFSRPRPTGRQRTQHEAVLASPAVSEEDLATVAGHEAKRRTAELLTQPPARLSKCTATDFMDNRASVLTPPS